MCSVITMGVRAGGKQWGSGSLLRSPRKRLQFLVHGGTSVTGMRDRVRRGPHSESHSTITKHSAPGMSEVVDESDLTYHSPKT